MHYALLQKDLTPPSHEALARAFGESGVLTAFDAHALGRDAFGILVNRLTREQALHLAQVLGRHGIEVEMVEQAHLPPIPATKHLHQLDALPETCRIYDPLGRPIDIAWGHIRLVASGIFPVRQSKRELVEQNRWLKPLSSTKEPVDIPEYRTTERWIGTPIVELTLTSSVLRYSLNPRSFRYNYLGPRLSSAVDENWVLLMQDLRQYATSALFNRGALSLGENPPVPLSYPSRNAFEEECIWLLWRAQRATE